MLTPMDVLRDHNIPMRQHGERSSNAGHGWVQVDCPYCSPHSERYRLGVHTRKGFWNCWLCGPQRTVETWSEVLHISMKAAWELVGQLPKSLEIDEPEKTGELVIPPGVGPLLKPHRKYLRSRGFNPDELAERYGVQGIGGCGGSLAWRIFIPIVYRGKTVSWTTRAIVDSPLRYISAGAERESMRGKSLLLGADLVRGAVVVHEGPMDSMRTGPGAVSLCGVSYTTAQVRQLAEIPRRVICFDSEPIAQARARKLADSLGVFPGTTHVVALETGKDAGEAGSAEIAELRSFAGLTA